MFTSPLESTYLTHQMEKAMAAHSNTLAWKNPMDGGAWWAAVQGVAQSRIRLKRLSSSSSKARLDQVNIILKKSHTFIKVCGLYTYS